MARDRVLRSSKASVKETHKVRVACERPELLHTSAVSTSKGVLKKRKYDADEHESRIRENGVHPPRTPARQKAPTVAIPSTSSNVGSPNHNDAQPHQTTTVSQRTNAPLVTPRGSRIVKRPLSGLFQKDPQATTPATNVLEEACAHLIKMDPRMKPLVEAYHCEPFSPKGLAEVCEPFRTLASGIMAQQVSGAAASAIKGRFVDLFRSPGNEHSDSYFPSPQAVGCCNVAFLRQAGLSQRKAEYIKGLAERFEDGSLSANVLLEATDDDVIERLTQVRGLGRWSAEMFACFGLKRTDIFATGDLGIQRGMALFVGKDIKKLRTAKAGGKWKYMSEKDMIEISQKFSPFRSIFMLYMWHLSDTKVNALEAP